MTDQVNIELHGSIIELHGLTDIQDRLRELPGRIARGIVISSLRKGASVIRKEIQKNVPVRTGTLRKGFKISRSRIHQGPQYGVYLTLKKGRGRHDPNDPFYGKFQDGGFKTGVRHIYVQEQHSGGYFKRVGTRLHGSGFVEGKNFIKNAYEAKKSEAIAVIVSTAEQKIEALTRNIGQ